MEDDDADNLIAGAVAGMIAETIMHPFDTLNTRLKVFSSPTASTAPGQRNRAPQPDSRGGSSSSKGSLRITGTRGMPSTVLHYTKPAVPRAQMMKFFPAHAPGLSLHHATMSGAIYQIVKTEGWRALYAGLPATLVGAVPATALYFGGYEFAKRLGERRYNDFADAAQAATGVRPDNEMVYLPAVYFAAGALGELASSSVYVPFEVVKSRLQMGANPYVSSGGWIPNKTNYKSTLDGFRLIWQGEGLPGLYAGWRANITLDCCFSGLQFLLYEILKRRMQRERQRLGACEDPDEELPLGPTFLIGAMAGGIAAVITNPLEVVVTRLMVQGHSLPETVRPIPPPSGGGGGGLAGAGARGVGSAPSSGITAAHADAVLRVPSAPPGSAAATLGGGGGGAGGSAAAGGVVRYRGIWHALQTIYRQEGLGGLLRGAVPRMVYNAPMAALTFAVYENIKQWFSVNRAERAARSRAEEGWVVEDESVQRQLREDARSLPFPKEVVLHRDYENAVRVTCRSASATHEFQGGGDDGQDGNGHDADGGSGGGGGGRRSGGAHRQHDPKKTLVALWKEEGPNLAETTTTATTHGAAAPAQRRGGARP